MCWTRGPTARIDSIELDESTLNHEIATTSSEKATKQQFLKDVGKEKVYLEIQVDVFGMQPEVKPKEVTKFSQALAESELEHNTDEISQCDVAQHELEKSHEEGPPAQSYWWNIYESS